MSHSTGDMQAPMSARWQRHGSIPARVWSSLQEVTWPLPSINSQMLKMTCKRQAHWVNKPKARRQKDQSEKNWKVEQSKAPRVAVGSMSIPAALLSKLRLQRSAPEAVPKHVHHHGSGIPLPRVPFLPLRKANKLRRTLLLQESLQTQDTFLVSVL